MYFNVINMKTIFMLPYPITIHGFTDSGDKIEIESITEIRNFIKLNFVKVERINSFCISCLLVEIIRKNLDVSVTNGMVISAMILEGFKFKKCGYNAIFNLSKKSIQKFLPYK